MQQRAEVTATDRINDLFLLQFAIGMSHLTAAAPTTAAMTAATATLTVGKAFSITATLATLASCTTT